MHATYSNGTAFHLGIAQATRRTWLNPIIVADHDQIYPNSLGRKLREEG